MRDAITNYLPWLMSLVTIGAIEVQGRKWPNAWALSLAGQGFWFVWIWASGQSGFLPMAAVLCFQYARNHMRWVREERQRAQARVRFVPQHWNCRCSAPELEPQEGELPRLVRPCGGCTTLLRCQSAGKCLRRHLRAI